MSIIRVLIVDDDEEDYLLTADLLDDSLRSDYEVTWVPTGDRALEVLGSQQIDVCLLDFMLGADTGIDLLKRIRGFRADLPCILLTGQSDDQIDEAALEAGASDYVVKTGLDADRIDRAIRYAVSQAELRATLAHQAFHDPLTGLANREFFAKRVAESLSRVGRNGGVVALLYLDLDGFKRINDGLGHRVGDLLFMELAQRLQASRRDHDLIARLGGDEFAICAEYPAGGTECLRFASRLLSIVAEPFFVDGNQLDITASIGVAIESSADTDVERFIHSADVAMYEAKARGKNNYSVFETEMHSMVLDRLRLESDLKPAIDNHEIRLDYQPIVRLADKYIVGFEGLARWHHPELGTMQPDLFIPLAEDTGRIRELGRNLLLDACMTAATWPTGPAGPPEIAVNVSPRQLADPEVLDFVADALEASTLDPRRLTLEITERAMILDVDVATKHLLQLREIGVRLAIDDFGTGFSSLSQIHRLPFEILKLDRSFVADLGLPAARTVTNTIARLAEGLELTPLAEGIENEAEAEQLQAFGYTLGQGFLYGRGMSAAEALATLEHQNAAPAIPHR